MSTLRVTNIQDESGSNASTAEEINKGRAKVWVNFNGTGTIAIRDSFNVSSVTDNSVGDYTVNIDNALSHANYSVSCSLRTVISSAATAQIKSTSSLTTTSFTVICFTTGGNYADSPEIFASVFS